MPSPARSSTPIMRSSIDYRPTSPIFMAPCTTAPKPEFATFRTSPRGRAPFTFTSFGDQGTPTLGRKYVPPAGVIDTKSPLCE